MRHANVATYGMGALLLAMVFSGVARAEMAYPLGGHANGNWGGGGIAAPFNLPYNNGVRYQIVYGNTEAGMNVVSAGGMLTAIEFSVQSSWNTTPMQLENCLVRVGYTTKQVMSGGTGGLETGMNNMNLNFKPNTYVATCINQTYSPQKIQHPGWTSTTVPYVAPGNVVKLNFLRPFAYNGMDNILVDISFTSRAANGGVTIFGTSSGRTIIYAQGPNVNSSTVAATVSSDFGFCYTGLEFTVNPTLDVQPAVNIFSQQPWPAGKGTVVTPANATGPAATNWTGDGLVVGKFDIVNPFQNIPASMTQITIQDRSIPGDSRTAYTPPAPPTTPPGNEYGVRLWRDSGPGGQPDGQFDPNFDVPIYDSTVPGTPGQNYTLDDGDIHFAVPTTEQNFNGNSSRTYFIVVKLRGAITGSLTPAPGDQYRSRVKTIAVPAGSGVNITGIPNPSPESCVPYFPGIDIEVPTFTYTEIQMGLQTAYLNSQNNVLMCFSVDYDRGPLNYQNTMTVEASGTGDDSVDYSGIRLVLDNDFNNQWTPGVDQVVSTIASGHFPQNDGTITFILATGPGEAGEFIAPVTKQFLILVDFNTIGTRGDTYQCQIINAGGHQFGAQTAGLPCPALPVPGLVLEGNDLLCTRIGPPPPDKTVSNISQGLNGWGELLLIVQITSLNRDWGVTDIVFTCTGVGINANPAAAFSEVALYEDLNANAPNFDGPAIDRLATSLTGTFTPTSPTTAQYSATIKDQAFASPIVRTFYLRVKLGGQALFGQRFYCNVTDITYNIAPSGGVVSLLPQPVLTNGLLIDAPTLTVTAAPTSPLSQIAEAGEAFGHTIAVFRFQAENDDIDIAGLNLTTGGTGDFFTDLDVASGIELYLDSEFLPLAPKDGLYTPGVDILLGQTGGNYPITSVPFNVSGPIVVPNGTSVDIIVRFNILATAGGSLPETFRCSIANPTDVLTAGSNAVILGIPAPNSNTVGVIIYFVSSFAPAVALRGGGAPITIIGAGFTPPFSCTIGGIPCPGNPVINSDGTGVSGLFIPAGNGLDLPIVVTTGALGSRLAPMRFSYATATTLNEKEARISNSFCAVNDSGPGAALAAMLAFAAMLAVASRVARRRES